ncbi:MAG: hypothetical protein J5564_01885 [Clostridia bacterium]|nr:hypothetical protein [Clostridia bacterium]
MSDPASSRRDSARRQSMRAAYCGMAAALSAALMLLGGVIPAATYAVPMLCGLILLPVLLEFDSRAAWITYAAAALIALLMDADKEAAFFYIFLGYYPIIKWRLDRVRSRPLRLLAKTALFLCSMGLMYGLLALLFPMAAFMREFGEMGLWMTILFVLLYVVCMLIYDRILLPMAMIYMNRIRPRLRFLKR